MAFTLGVEHGNVMDMDIHRLRGRATGSRRLFDRAAVPPGQAEWNVMRPQDHYGAGHRGKSPVKLRKIHNHLLYW